MARVLLTVALVGFVAWGATAAPGRPFSWAMFTGSSKAFLWTETGGVARVPTFEDLRLAPDSHYLLAADFHQLARESGAPVPLRGLIVGTRDSWQLDADGSDDGTRVVPLAAGDELAQLAESVRRLGCRYR